MSIGMRASRLLSNEGAFGLIKGLARFVYWRSGLRSVRYWLGYNVHGSPISTSVEDTTATFKVTSRREYARTRTLHNEKQVIADLIRTLNQSDVFYDVGANVGTYTCFAGQHLKQGTVVSFEPHPGNANRLRENVSLNNLSVDLQQMALSNESGSSKLALSGGSDEAGVGTHSLSTGGNGKNLDIDLIEGDQLIRSGEVPPPNVMKIDVEGAEQLVLEGLLSTLEDGYCHTIYCEVHPDRITDFGGSVSKLREILESKGYSISRIENRSPEYFLKAERNTE